MSSTRGTGNRPKLPPLRILRKQIEANRRRALDWPDGEPPIPPGVREKADEFGLVAGGGADWKWYRVGDLPSRNPATGYCRCKQGTIQVGGAAMTVKDWKIVYSRPTTDGGWEEAAMAVHHGPAAPATARQVLMNWYRYRDFAGRQQHIALGQCDLCLRVLWHAPGLSREEPEHASRRRRR